MAFARILIEEYGADVDERYERDGLMHRRWGRESISTPLYEAVRNNFPSMVELLLEKGADGGVRGHKGMRLVECAWNNKHGGMVRLLRERGVPEGPETEGKDVAILGRRAETPVRALTGAGAGESFDEMDAGERRWLTYAALRP